MALRFALLDERSNGRKPLVVEDDVTLHNLPKLICLLLKRIQHYHDPVELQLVAIQKKLEEHFSPALNVLVVSSGGIFDEIGQVLDCFFGQYEFANLFFACYLLNRLEEFFELN